MAHRNSLPSSSSSTSASSSASSIHLSASQQADGARNAQYQFSKGLLVAVNGGSRVVSYCEPLSCLLASQPSPQPTLVPGETPTTTTTTRSSSVDLKALSKLCHTQETNDLTSHLTNAVYIFLWLPRQAGV